MPIGEHPNNGRFGTPMNALIQDESNPQQACKMIISIESQKGGVGKTTVSLALASLLLKLSWHVLIIDADLVGTSLKIPATASLWKSMTRSLSLHDGSEVELQALYKGWLSGSGIPQMEFDCDQKETDARTLSAQSSKVNFISCEPIGYDMSLVPLLQESELNVELLSEFLLQLAGSFMTGAMRRASKGIAVVIDNSPGSHGLVSSIEERLSLIGPLLGKIVFVAGPESHDLHATAIAIDRAHERLARKERSIRLFFTGKRVGALHSRDLTGLDDSDLEFLAMLAQASNHEDRCLDSIYSSLFNKGYFRAALEVRSMPREPTVISHIGVLINRVPVWLSPSQVDRLIAHNMPNLLIDPIAKRRPRTQSVPILRYMPGLDAQAIHDEDLADTSGTWASDGSIRHAIERLRQSSVRLHAEGKDLKEALWRRRTGDGAVEDLLSYLNQFIRKMERDVGVGLDLFTRHVDPGLRRAFQPEWLPESFNYRLRKYISHNMFHDGSLNDPNILTSAKPIPKGAISGFADAYRRVVKGLSPTALHGNYLRNTLLACMFASVPLTVSYDVLSDLADLIRSISINLERRWRSLRPYSTVVMPGALWINEQRPDETILKALGKVISSEQECDEFYSALIEAAGRLVDLPTDCSLLLGAAGKIIVAAHNSPTSIPPILQVLQDVVQDKSLVLDEKLEILERTKLASHITETLEKTLYSIFEHWTTS
jgi:hypothetical protein